MGIKCRNCEASVETLNFSKASVVFSDRHHVPAVRIVLVCPHCSQHYLSDVPLMEFEPCEVKMGFASPEVPDEN